MQPQTFLFFGRSGCGKGTQAALLRDYLAKKDGRAALSVETGRELRAFVDKYASKGNYSAALVKEVLEKGALLPEFLPIWAWTGYFVEHVKGNEHLVLDGLSRRSTEAPVLDGALRFYKRESPAVIFMEVSRQWSMERLLARGRYDDSREEINKRLDWFDEQAAPTLGFFRKNSYYRFITVNGEQTIEAVHKEILRKTGLEN